MSSYSKVSVADDARTELHDKLSLTGGEISIKQLPGGGCEPIVHAHKINEEIYGILSGKGKAVIDEETVELTAGDWLRVSPAAKRQFFAAEDTGISYVCIQVKENSLEGYTMDDAISFCVTVHPAELLWHPDIENLFAMDRMPAGTILSYGLCSKRTDLAERQRV